ncbi:MAG: hypothetical protein IJT56_03080 [Clostridia bacterium]|nr:hypothetical protein [Clostridia bacterium]
MKKLLASVLGATMALTMVAAPIVSNAEFGRSYDAMYGQPTIDGTAEALWDMVEWTQVDKPYDGSDAADYPGASLRMKFLWDETNLYFLADVTDSDVNYDNDIVEIYLDEDNCKAGEYQEDDSQSRFFKDGAPASGGTNTKADISEAVGVDTAGGWVIEGKIPWNNAMKVGQAIGFELMYNIGDSDADFAQAFRWNADTGNGDPAPWQSTEAWGVMNLNPAPEAEALEGNAVALWDFGESDCGIKDFNAMDIALNGDYATFTASGPDPYGYIDMNVADVSAMQWAKIRVRNTSAVKAIELFAKTDGDGHGLSGPECTHIYMVPNTEEWMTYIVYLPNANIYTSTNIKGTALDAWNWQGMCDGIRLDPMWQGADGDMVDGDTIQIDYIAFFETKEAAENFRKRQDSAVVPVEFENGTDLPDLSALTAAAEVVEDVKDAAETVAEAVGDAAEAVGEAAEGAVEAVGEAAANTAETVKEAASGANTGLIIGIVIACVVVIAAVVAFIVSKKKKKE